MPGGAVTSRPAVEPDPPERGRAGCTNDPSQSVRRRRKNGCRAASFSRCRPICRARRSRLRCRRSPRTRSSPCRAAGDRESSPRPGIRQGLPVRRRAAPSSSSTRGSPGAAPTSITGAGSRRSAARAITRSPSTSPASAAAARRPASTTATWKMASPSCAGGLALSRFISGGSAPEASGHTLPSAAAATSPAPCSRTSRRT